MYNDITLLKSKNFEEELKKIKASEIYQGIIPNVYKKNEQFQEYFDNFLKNSLKMNDNNIEKTLKVLPSLYAVAQVSFKIPKK